MTHPSTPLHPSSAVQLAARALATQGAYGTVTDLAREHGLRRQQIYELRERGRAALQAEFSDSDLGTGTKCTLDVTEAHMERAAIALRVVTPASVRDIVEVLPMLFGTGWSYGKVWNVLAEAERSAAELLRQVDLSDIENVALDEMFSQGRPVLAGIDLDTQYLFLADVRDSRSGAEWAEALEMLREEQSLYPECVVKDAGTGLAAGVRAAWPKADEHDDLFHAVYAMGKVAQQLENAAYRVIREEDALERRRARAHRESERRSLGQQLRRTRDHVDHAITRCDAFEALRREATSVLELADRGSGRLRTSAEVVEVLTRVADAMKAISGKRVRKVARYLRNRAVGLGRYLDALAARLAAVTEEAGGVEVVEACIRAYQASLQASRRGPRWDRKAREQEITEATRHLLAVTERDSERLQRAMGTVLPVLSRRYRASSAIENLNSVLRPYLVVQKHAQQGFLNLFRFYWNTRTRQWGAMKGTSAHELLTGEPVADWLTLLGFPPVEPVTAAA